MFKELEINLLEKVTLFFTKNILEYHIFTNKKQTQD